MSSKTAHNCGLIEQMQGYLPRRMEELTPEMIQQAEIELNETPTRKEEALRELKDLIKKERDFQPLTDEKFLLRFLRARKFNTQAAMKMLKNHYTYKVRYSGKLTEILPSQMEHVIHSNLLHYLPHRDQKGRIVALAKYGRVDLNKTPLYDVVGTSFLNTDFCLQSEATQICGVVSVIDLKGLSLHIARHMASPALLYRLFKAIQEVIPMRLKGFHIINEPFYFRMIYKIIRIFLSEKMKRRFHCNGTNLENFHKEVPPEILPREFGGQLGPMNNKDFGEEILGAEDYFLKLCTYRYEGKTVEDIRRRRSSQFFQ